MMRRVPGSSTQFYMALTTKQRQHLRALAHKRKPVVLLGGAGVTDAVLREIDRALERHELLKIRLPGLDREERAHMVQRICEATHAEPVQEIGRMAVMYRRAEKPRLVVPAG
jgi:RNA-binding protein